MTKGTTSGPGNHPEKAPTKRTYPLGKQMKKGSKLDCLGCNGKNPRCGGCGGTGKIKV